MTDLATFLGKTASVTEGAKGNDPAENEVKQRVVDAPTSTTPPPSATEEVTQESVTQDSVIVTDITPSGIEVLYQAAPKRLYRVNGVEVPSVTTVLDLIHKPALTWYGQRMGVQGVLDLFDMGVLSSAFDWDTDKERLTVNDTYADEKAITAKLTEHKLTVNHRRDQAADRGTNVHDALEQWGNTGQLPNPDDFPETEKGYVQGLVRFLEDVRPEPVRQEVMVGSVQHRFAGRFDLVFGVAEAREFTSKCYPKKKDKREMIEPAVYLGDLKTSKGTYATHHLQLAAYELAAVECGYPATYKQAVIHVTEDGKYELVMSQATGDDFLAIRAAYDALKGLPE